MKQNFIARGLRLSVRRMEDTTLNLHISSDYSRSNHKGQLHVNEKSLSDDVEQFWKSIKTKKLLMLDVYFDEIDYYDNMTDIYNTPHVFIKRGLKKARVNQNEHGSIPKDWTFDFNAKFSDTTANTPIMEVVKSALGSFFTPTLEKQFVKRLKLVLQKKEKHCYVETEYNS